MLELDTRFVEFDDKINDQDQIIVVSTALQAVTLSIPSVVENLNSTGDPFLLENQKVAIIHLIGNNPLTIKLSNDRREQFYIDDAPRFQNTISNEIIYLRRRGAQYIPNLPEKDVNIQFGWDVERFQMYINDFNIARTDILSFKSTRQINNDADGFYVFGFLTIEPGKNFVVVLESENGIIWKRVDLIPEVESIVNNLKTLSEEQHNTTFENRFFKIIVRADDIDGQLITNLDDEWH